MQFVSQKKKVELSLCALESGVTLIIPDAPDSIFIGVTN